MSTAGGAYRGPRPLTHLGDLGQRNGSFATGEGRLGLLAVAVVSRRQFLSLLRSVVSCFVLFGYAVSYGDHSSKYTMF